MKRPYLFAAFSLAIAALLFAFAIRAEAATVCNIFNGCLGTSTVPAYGQLLIGGKNGEYEFVASSTLGGGGAGAVSSVFGRTGGVTAQAGDYTTSQITEGSNLYFTNARAVAALTGQSNSIFTNGAGYLTSLAGAASSTVLGDNNTFSGIDVFSNGLSNFAGTWQGFSPSHFQVAGNYLTADPFWVYASGAVSTSTPVLITASSTIGNGTTVGGFTVNGGATTTGNAYFGGTIGLTSGNTTFASGNPLFYDGTKIASIKQIYVNAKCNGVTDDSGVINTAIVSASSGEALILPSGTCYIGSSIQFPIGVNYLTLEGSGAGGATIIETDQNIPTISVGSYAYSGVNDWSQATSTNGIEIKNLFLYNTSVTKTNTAGVVINGSERGTYDNILCSGIASCIVVNPITEWNFIENIKGQGVGLSNTVLVNGNGYTNNYNSTGNTYLNIQGQAVANAIMEFTGCTFGDSDITNVIGTGIASGGTGAAGGAIAAVYLDSPGTFCTDGATRYASRINIDNVDMDGISDYVVRGIDADHISVGNTVQGGAVTNNVSFDASSTSIFRGAFNLNGTSLIYSSGNFGIATGTPGSLLSLNGIANFTSATSTFYSTGGINLKSGCFAIGGTCLGTLALTGTTGQVAYFSGTNTAAGTSSLFIIPSGNVGIGTTTPSATLAVSNPTVNGQVFQSSADQTTANPFQLILKGYTDNSQQLLIGYNTTSNFGSIQAIHQGVSVEPFILNPSGGNIGIGTTTPFSRLTIEGTTTTSGKSFSIFNSAGVENFTVLDNGDLGLGTTTPTAPLTINNDSTTGNQLLIDGDTNPAQQLLIGYNTTSDYGSIQAVKQGSAFEPLILNRSGGSVGVGTTSPGSLFSVAGTSGILASTTATSTFIGGGINLITGAGNTGCFAINGSCLTNYSATYPVLLSAGAFSLAFGTTTSNLWAGTQTFTNPPVFSSLGAGTVNVTSSGTIYNSATSTPGVTGPITYSGTLGSLIGGVSGNFGCTTAAGGITGCLTGADWTNFNSKISSSSLSATYPLSYNSGTGAFTAYVIGTTSPWTNGNLAEVSGGNLTSIPTTTASCSGSASCTPFTILGNSPITISDSGGSGLTWPWNITTNDGQSANSTSTLEWLQASPFALAASGTIDVSGQSGGYAIDENTILQASSTNGNLNVGQGAGPSLLSSSIHNVAIGLNALTNATSTNGSVAIGWDAIQGGAAESTFSGANVAIGAQSLMSITTGGGLLAVANVAIGSSTLRLLTTGQANTAIGANAGKAIVTAGFTTFVGSNAGTADTANNNSGFGTNALLSNTSGAGNTGLGFQALLKVLTHNNDTAVGFTSMGSTTGDANTGLGTNTGLNLINTTSASSTFIGAFAGYGSLAGYTGSGNTLLGASTGYNLGSSNWNTFVGAQAGFNVTTGSDNILIGSASTTANDNLTTGDDNIKIGDNISLPLAAGNAQLDIGNIIFGTGVNGAGTTVAGNVGIATTTPGSLFSINSIANFTTATSTFYGNGLSLTSGCYAIVLTCLPTLSASQTWTGLQTFNNASTTLETVTTDWVGTLNLTNALTIGNGGTGLTTIGASSTVLTTNGTSAAWQQLNLAAAVYGVLPAANGGTGATSLSSFFSVVSNALTSNEHHSFSYSTSTAWTGTTTVPLEIGYGETWKTVRCFTNTGTLNVDFYHATNHLNFVNASTTKGTITFSSNNTMTAGDSVYVDLGTPASSPTTVTCTEGDQF